VLRPRTDGTWTSSIPRRSPFFDEALGQLEAHYQLPDLRPRERELALLGLGPAYGAVAALRDVERSSITGVAESSGIGIANAKTRVHRALRPSIEMLVGDISDFATDHGRVEDMEPPRRGKRPGFEVILLVPVLLAFSGCMVGPDFKRPEVAVSETWLATRDRRVSTESATYRSWWTAFKDPALDRLVEQAYRENLSLRQAGVRVLQARAQLGIAIGDVFPQTQQAVGSVQYLRTSDRAATAGFIGGGSALEYWQSEIGVQTSWELDFWGRIRRGIESADASLLASLADYDNTLVTLTAAVANNYITVRTAEERIRIARENAETQEQILRITEARFRFGTVTQLDVEQARTQLLNTLASIPPLEAQRRQAQDALSVLLGMPPRDLSELLEGSSGIPVSSPEVIVGIPADLLRRRPDVRSAELQAVAQSAQIGVAKADLFPAFTLVGSLVFLSTDLGTFRLSDMFRWGSRSIQAGPSVQWNILNYGQIRNNVRVQDASFQQLLIAYQNAVLSAQQDVEDNLVAFLRAQDRADLLARSVTSAKAALDLAVLQYREGVTDFTTVLTGQQTLLSQQDSLTSTLGTISTSLVGVYRALGGGWEIREGEDLVPPAIKAEMQRRTNWGRLLAPANYNLPASRQAHSAPQLPDW
jgi:NodT family efflux transporter outer membrane factor (OMF) lipoprotein